MNSKRGHYHALPWIARPPKSERIRHSISHPLEATNHTSHDSSQEFGKEQAAVTVHHTQHHDEHTTHHSPHAAEQLPIFSEREEATPLELFYDLFFVANLSAFTNNHAIDSLRNLSSYVGFFSLLWFTWLQFTLYDVRFSVDSVFERAAKALHLAVMIGFAAIGTNFDTSDTAKNSTPFQTLSFILMVSHLVLFSQYASILLWTRIHKHLRTPILIHMGILAAGAIVCLGVAFSFDGKKETHVYLMWYVLVVFEGLAMFVTSSRWRKVSFQRTNLNERCNVLTLIILGEGVIVLTKSFTYITMGQNYSPKVIGQIISSCIIIYFLFMIYFDQSCKGFGTIRQQFWALAHFPFHVCLVLVLEGVSRFVMWVNALEVVNPVIDSLGTVLEFATTDNFTEAVTQINDIRNVVYTEIKDKVSFFEYGIDGKIETYANVTDPQSDEALSAGYDVVVSLANAILKFFKITGPKKSKAAKIDATWKFADSGKELGDVTKVYDLVYEYMFITAGFTLIIMAALIIIAKKRKVAGDWAAVATRLFFGIAIACLATMVTNGDRQARFMASAWMLPTVALTFVVVVLVDAVFGYVLPAAKDQGAKHEGHH